jgi:hypothetical protein
MARFISHPKYSTGFDTANYRMIVPEGYARYAVLEGLGPGGAAVDIVMETTPGDAFHVELTGSDDPKPPPGANMTLRIGAKKPGSGRIRALFKGNDYSQPLPVQVTPDSDGTVRAMQESFRLSSQALAKAKERLEELRKSLVAAMGSLAFQANWLVILERYYTVANVLNLPDPKIESLQVNATPKQKILFGTALPTITGALDRITSSIGLWGNGETAFLMRSDLEPDYARVSGFTRDDRLNGIELMKLSFSYSGPLGRAQTILHERFHLTGARHGEDFFKNKPKPQTGYEKNQNTFRRVDNAEALSFLVCCLAYDIIDPAEVGKRGK